MWNRSAITSGPCKECPSGLQARWQHRSGRLGAVPKAPGDERATQAHALVEQLFALLHECCTVVLQVEAARTDPESVSAQAE